MNAKMLAISQTGSYNRDYEQAVSLYMQNKKMKCKNDSWHSFSVLEAGKAKNIAFIGHGPS